MKNVKLNSKKILAIILSGFVIITSTGCRTNKEETNQYSSDNNYTVENNINVESSKEETSLKETVSKNSSSQEIVSEKEEISSATSKTDEYTKEDNQVIEYFNEIETNVDEVLNSEAVENAKDKLKGTFITVVDFIFYDAEIKGIKFDDLTEGAKQNILETATSIDNKIMIKFPNYKEDISSTTSKAYTKASEVIKKGANNIKEFSKEKLGEENYNAIKDVKDELVYYTKEAFGIVGDAVSTIWDKGKDKVKNWYQNIKNN